MKLLITSALLILAISPLAQAKHDRSDYNAREHSGKVVKARVINSTPIYKYVTVHQPQSYCEPKVRYRTRRHSGEDNSTAIIGGIIGGVIGHAASDNKHKGAGTLIGAVIGSSLMHNVARANSNRANNNYSISYRVKQQNCSHTYNKASKVRVLDGYEVTYRAKGKLYRTFTQQKPNRYIRIYD